MTASQKLPAFHNEIQAYQAFLSKNVAALMSNATCMPTPEKDCHIVYLDGPPAYNKTGPVFNSAWNMPLVEARPMSQASALDLLNAAIAGPVRCSGKQCKYDPPNPPPQKLSCDDNPCPKGQDCCGSGSSYYTCCAVGQKCLDGDYCE